MEFNTEKLARENYEYLTEALNFKIDEYFKQEEMRLEIADTKRIVKTVLSIESGSAEGQKALTAIRANKLESIYDSGLEGKRVTEVAAEVIAYNLHLDKKLSQIKDEPRKFFTITSSYVVLFIVDNELIKTK